MEDDFLMTSRAQSEAKDDGTALMILLRAHGAGAGEVTAELALLNEHGPTLPPEA